MDVEVGISIVTVVKDDDEGLRKTLASMRAQACKECEYVIINGGKSFDKKLEKEVLDTQLEFGRNVLLEEPDNGIYDAMNKGARLAKGDYVLYINAGDTLYDKSVIENLVLNVNSRETAFYVGDYCYVDWDGNENIRRVAQNPISAYTAILHGRFGNLYDRGIPHHNSTLTKRELLLKYPYDGERFPISADTRQFLTCLNEGSISVKLLPFIINRFVFGGMSGTNRLEVLAEQREMMMDVTNNPAGVDEYIKSAILNEFMVQRKFGIKLRDVWKIAKHYPIETLLSWWSAYHQIDPKPLIEAKVILVIALTGGTGVRKTLEYISSNAGVKPIAFSANQAGARAIRVIDKQANIEPIEDTLIRAAKMPSSTYVVVITDDEPLTPAMKECVYNLGIKSFIWSHGGKLSRVKLNKPRVIGQTTDGFPVYEKGL